jgi:rSAM/selenodomain-associated transferase 1
MERVSSQGVRQILVFSKAPVRGQVKTRLRTELSDDDCLALHLAMLQDTLECCSASGARVTVYVSEPSKLETDLPIRLQSGKDLGERMKNAFEENIGEGPVVIVGIDSPGLTTQLLDDAFAALVNHDLVLGPSLDGGYYLIGVNGMIPEIFHDIPWSTSDVLTLTLQRSRRHTTHLLRELYDIDTPQDLLRLRADHATLSSAKHTQRWIKQRKKRS